LYPKGLISELKKKIKRTHAGDDPAAEAFEQSIKNFALG
jgi:hypothetical protein